MKTTNQTTTNIIRIKYKVVLALHHIYLGNWIAQSIQEDKFEHHQQNEHLGNDEESLTIQNIFGVIHNTYHFGDNKFKINRKLKLIQLGWMLGVCMWVSRLKWCWNSQEQSKGIQSTLYLCVRTECSMRKAQQNQVIIYSHQTMPHYISNSTTTSITIKITCQRRKKEREGRKSVATQSWMMWKELKPHALTQCTRKSECNY